VIGTTRQVRVYACAHPVDMRKGFDGLTAIVTNELDRDPLSGDLFLFANRTRKRAKVLMWDGTGLCVFAKRLERGLFASLWRTPGSVVTLTTSELALFLEGSDLVGRVALSPAPFVLDTFHKKFHKHLAIDS
jgi:transposase